MFTLLITSCHMEHSELSAGYSFLNESVLFLAYVLCKTFRPLKFILLDPLLIAILRYNFHAIKFTHCKWFLIKKKSHYYKLHCELCHHHHNPVLEYICQPRKFLHVCSHSLLFYPVPRNHWSAHCPPWFCLFLKLHVNGIMYCV